MAQNKTTTVLITSLSIVLGLSLATVSALAYFGVIDIFDVYYQVKFVNYDGTVLQESEVKKGENAVYEGSTPTRDNETQYNFVFSGWSQSTENVQGDTVFVALYEQRNNIFKVEFYNEEELIYQVDVPYGKPVVYQGEEPTRPGGDDYVYKFLGWDINNNGTVDELPTSLKSSLTCRAIYLAKQSQYTVTFKNYDDTYLGEDSVYHGDAASYNGEIPTRVSENPNEIYIFTGWVKYQ